MASFVPYNLNEMSSAKAERLQLSRVYIMRMPFVQQATLRLTALTDDGMNQAPIPRVTASPWDMPRVDQVNDEPVRVPRISTIRVTEQKPSRFTVHNDEQSHTPPISLEKSIHLRKFAKQKAPAVQSPSYEIFHQPVMSKSTSSPSSAANKTNDPKHNHVECRDYAQSNTMQPLAPKLAPAFENELKRKSFVPCQSSQTVKPTKLPKIVVDLTSPEGLASKVVIDLRSPEAGNVEGPGPSVIDETQTICSQTGGGNSINKGSIPATALIVPDILKPVQQYSNGHVQHACPETFHVGSFRSPLLEKKNVINAPMSSYDPFANRHFPSAHHRREKSSRSHIPDLTALLSSPEAFNRRTIQDLPPQVLRVLGNRLSEDFEAVRYGSNELTGIPDGMRHLKIVPISNGRDQPRVIASKTASRSSRGSSSFESSQSTTSMRSSLESSIPASVCWSRDGEPGEGWDKQFDVYCDSSEKTIPNTQEGNELDKTFNESAEHKDKNESFPSPRGDTAEEGEEEDDGDEDDLPPYWAPSLSSLMATHLLNKNTLIEETLPVRLSFTIAPRPGSQSFGKGSIDTISTHQRVLVVEKSNVARLRMLRFILPSLESRWIDGPGLQGQGGITARSNLPRDWVVFEIVERRNPGDAEDLYGGEAEDEAVAGDADDDDHGRSFLHIAVPYQAIADSSRIEPPTSDPASARRPALPPVPDFRKLAGQRTPPPPPPHESPTHPLSPLSRTPDHHEDDDADKSSTHTQGPMNGVHDRTKSPTPLVLLLQKRGKYPLLHGRAIFSNPHDNDNDDDDDDKDIDAKNSYAHKLFMLGNWAEACAEGRGGVVAEA